MGLKNFVPEIESVEDGPRLNLWLTSGCERTSEWVRLP